MIAVLILLLAVGLVYAVVQMKAGAEWGKPATVALAVLIILLAVVRVSCRGAGPTRTDVAEAEEAGFTIAQGAADALGRQLPSGGSVLVFALSADPDSHDALEDGLKKGFEPHNVAIAAIVPPFEPGSPEQHQRAFDALIARHPGVAAILIFGDPANNMEDFVPQPTKGRTPPLTGIVAERLTAAQALQRVKDGTAVAVVVRRPDIDWAAVARLRPRKRFERTYLVVTPDTVAETEKEL